MCNHITVIVGRRTRKAKELQRRVSCQKLGVLHYNFCFVHADVFFIVWCIQAPLTADCCWTLLVFPVSAGLFLILIASDRIIMKNVYCWLLSWRAKIRLSIVLGMVLFGRSCVAWHGKGLEWNVGRPTGRTQCGWCYIFFGFLMFD